LVWVGGLQAMHSLHVVAAKIWVTGFKRLLSANHTSSAHFFLSNYN